MNNAKDKAERFAPTEGCRKTDYEPISEYQYQKQQQLAYIAGYAEGEKDGVARVLALLRSDDRHHGHFQTVANWIEREIGGGK